MAPGRPAADHLHVTEVTACAREALALDRVDGLVDRIETDVLPMMVTLRSVGPDVHDLLDITRELKKDGAIPADDER